MFKRIPLARIVKSCDSYNQNNQLITYMTAEYISRLTTRSTFSSNYETFVNQIQIPFETFCLKILQHIETQFIHIPLVKEIVKKQFFLFFSLSNKDSTLNYIAARFRNFIDFFDIRYTLDFDIKLELRTFKYVFDIYDSKNKTNFSEIIKRCQILDNKSMNLLEKKFSFNKNTKNKLTEHYFKVYTGSGYEYVEIKNFSEILNTPNITRITIEENEKPYNFREDSATRFFRGFEKFLILSLLATSENAIDEINYILNYDQTKKINKPMKPQETYIEESELNQYIKTLKRKKHIIFQGSPGTGKTYLAKHIAKHLISSGDGFYELIQFHPSYSYEDFIQGIRPQTSSDGNLKYSMIPGRFLTFCEKAENCEDMCILIIDEINRANLSQVFGELMYLLEYREEKIKLAGSDQEFKIPENVYIIGTMNTADRSIALVDHALRRRFAFIAIKPNYDILRKYHKKHNPNYDIESLINILKELNQTINDRHYEIGVSFFLTETLPEDLENIWIMEIEPYLEEYFFDETDKIDKFRWINI